MTDKNPINYAPERTPPRDEFGMFWHPDLPDCGEDESIIPLLLAQGFDGAVVAGESEFPEEAIEGGHDAYWAAMRAWQPTPPQGDGWLLVAIYDHENGPHALFVRPWPEPADDIERACRVLAVLHDRSSKEALRDGRLALAAVHREAVHLFGYMLDLHRIYTAPPADPAKASEPEYDRDMIADMLTDYANLGPRFTRTAIREQIRLLRAVDNADAAKVRTVRASGSAPDVSDEAIERALDAKIGLDKTLRQLIRGDTMAVGYSKVDVVRALLAELGSTATPPASAPESRGEGNNNG